MAGFIVGMSLLLYFVIAAVITRMVYVHTYKAYFRWRNEAPDSMERYWSGGEYEMTPTKRARRDISYRIWRSKIDHASPAALVGFFWIFFGLFLAGGWLLFRDVKSPDQVLISDLEKEVQRGSR